MRICRRDRGTLIMFQHFLLGMASGVIVSLVQRQGYKCWNRFFSKAFYSLHHLPFKESFERNRKNTGCRQQSTRCFMPGKINEVDFATKFSSVKSKAKTRNKETTKTKRPISQLMVLFFMVIKYRI